MSDHFPDALTNPCLVHPVLRLTILTTAVLILVALPQLIGGGLVDDAYIFGRYADHIAAGAGPVFNHGDRVEGYTSPLHTFMIAVLVALGASDAARAAGWLSTIACVGVLLVLAGYRSSRDDRGLSGVLAAVLATGAVPLALWASTGMDTALFALCTAALAVSWARDVLESDQEFLSTRTWLLCGIGTLARPEGHLALFLALGIELPRIIRHRRELKRWRGPLAGLLLPAAWLLFRLVYYSAWFPNTFYAKVDGGTPALWGRGLWYVADSIIDLSPLVILAVAGVIIAVWHGRPHHPALLGAALLTGIVFEGGDHFPLYRFFVPVIPLASILGATAIMTWFPATRARVLASIAAAALTGLWSVRAPSVSPGDVATSLERFRLEVKLARTWDWMGRELLRRLGPDHSIALTMAGAIPYRTGWRTVDMVGLLDRHIGRVPMALGHGYPGHEKFDADYVLDRRPDLILIHTWLWMHPVPEDVAIGHVIGDAHQAMASSTRFRSEYHLLWIEVPGGFIGVFVPRVST